MKIVILHTDFRIYWPARIKALHAYLLALGHSLVVIEIAGKGSPYAFSEHADISDFPSWIILFPEEKVENISVRDAHRSVYRKLDELNPDVLLSGALAFYSGAAAVKWAGGRSKPLVIFDNARLKDVPRNWMTNQIKRQLYKLADAIFCPAPSHAHSFEYWGFKHESIFYGLNCVDNAFFKDDRRTDALLNLPSRYFLTVGRQVPKKNIAFLIRSYKQYLKTTEESPVSLVIVGDGPQNKVLRLMAGDLIDSYIFFLPFKTQEELIPLYSNCTAYILPSLGETWGLTVNEAMVCSKPVLVSGQCGCAETLVIPGRNGWIFDPEKAEELSGLLLKMGSMESRAIAEMGVRSEAHIADWGLEHFTSGIWSSINYAINRNQTFNKTKLVLPRSFSFLWKGRFRLEMPSKIRNNSSILRLVVLHTDLRIYWQARLFNLQETLNKIGINLDVIEIAGKGSPYSFEKERADSEILRWHILFPHQGPGEIPSAISQQAIERKLDELNPDVVLAGAIAFQSGTGALKWKAKTGKPIIIFDDARQIDVKRNIYINKIKENLYSLVDAILCPAPSHRESFDKWGLKSNEIFYGIDVVDNDLFKRKSRNNQVTSEMTEISEPYLLAVGRQIEKKNWESLLKAFVQFKKENPASLLNLVFIGDGPMHQTLVDVSVVEQRVDIIFIPFIQQSALIQYYHHAKGLVLPTRYGETWGLVVNEAMAAGLPVLVSRECGCSQTLVSEGVNGWLFDPDNLTEITEAIRKLDQLSPSQWSAMGQASFQIIKEWDLPRFTQGVLEALIHVSTKPKTKSDWVGKFLLNFWNGRYRPV
ncbi:MAG: glycosyltransferase family 4 protein [Mariniphaga sp.]